MKSPKSRATEIGTLVGVRLQDSELALIDAWRKDQADLPSQPEAIRRIVGQCLSAPADQGTIAAEELNSSNDE